MLQNTSSQKKYLIIDYDKAVSKKEMTDLCFSALVALGMITTDIHLNECWLFAYTTRDKHRESGLFYQSLVPSIHCEYRIFSTNVYPFLISVAKQIDPVKGESRAVDIISHLHLSNAIHDFPCDVFGRLIDNMCQYEELQRGIFIILMGSNLHLEIQAATYCVALEAISNLSPIIAGQKEDNIVKNKASWKQVHKRFRILIQELAQEQLISDKEKKDLEKKIDSINKAFNSEKLRSLLMYYRYPMRLFDELTLFLRNLLLHGSIKFKVLKGREPEDYLFELSMNLHKLCCSIALLMAGFKGYIINNRKLYGFSGSYKAFIRIGDNTKADYPQYHPPKNAWDRIKESLIRFWKSFAL